MEGDASIAGAIDVVIPMRNGAATILAALATVCGQTLPPRRIIVVDDGSCDGGAELVRGHPLVDVVVTPPRGVSHARNTGIRSSRAEFVALLDCDDLWRADKLERQFEVARRHPEAAVITCDHVGVTPSGVPVPAIQVRPRYEGWVLQDLLEVCFLLGGWSSSMLVRRDAALAVGGYDETRRFFEDVDFCFALAARYPIAYCPEVLTNVVENPLSTTRRTKEAAFVLEVILQGLTVVEKWISVSEAPSRLGRQAALFILSKYLRNGLSPARLLKLQKQIAERAPILASHIARDMPHFAFCLVQAGVLGFGTLAGGALRHFGNVAARFKPLTARLPQVETIS